MKRISTGHASVWLALAALAAGAIAPAGVAAGPGARSSLFAPARPSAGPQGSFAARVLLLPIGFVLGNVVRAPELERPLPNSSLLRRDEGWTELQIPVGDEGLGVYLEVAGRVRFAAAMVRFADGTEHAIDLDRAARGRGVYELLVFDGSRRVAAVQLRAVALSPSAQVGVRLGR